MDNRKVSKNLFNFFEPIMIVVFWLLLFLAPVVLSEFNDVFNWNHVFRVWISFIPYLIIFLINRYVLLPYLFFEKKRIYFLMSALMLIAVMVIGDFYFGGDILEKENRMERAEQQLPTQRFHNPPPTRSKNLPPQRPPRELPPYVGFVVISILIIGFDTGLRISVKWVRTEQMQSFIEKENMQMQLAYLRNQISPHFFMNTLNNIHALIDIDTDEAKESIIRLSKLMRHLLYDCDAETIPITKEVEFIRNYVALMRLRYSNKIRIELSVPSQLPEKQIPPLLFTSFVENAFKHGVSYQKPMSISISFSCTDDKLHFQVRNNHVGSKSENTYSGIGIGNSRKRLDLIYGDRYKLDIEDKKDEFIVSLNIPL
jgi:hypothetical protein